MQVDIYSFGVLVWELVTATPPMRGRLRPIKVCFAAAMTMDQHMHRCCMQTNKPLAAFLYIPLKLTE